MIMTIITRLSGTGCPRRIMLEEMHLAKSLLVDHVSADDLQSCICHAGLNSYDARFTLP
jgi:hypothetical protein